MTDTPFMAQRRKLHALRAKQDAAESGGVTKKSKKKASKKKTGASTTE